MKYTQLKEKIVNTNSINTHSHHLGDAFFKKFDLDTLLARSYVDWCGVKFSEDYDSRKNYIDKVKFKSYFVYLQKAIKKIYHIDADLSADTWSIYSDTIKEAHEKDGDWHKKILREKCKYEKILLDAYWNPGADNGDPSLFSPVFRINPLFFGYSKEASDHNEHNVFELYDESFESLEGFLDFVQIKIKEKISQGCVALKIPIAYDRDLDFKNTSSRKASRVFMQSENHPDDIVNFQDYLAFQVCEIASSLDIPVQIHTGMGCMNKTAPRYLLKLIEENPKTQFVLFHAGFPWTEDIIGMMHLFPNVYADLCWLPLLSPTEAKNTLHQLIEIGTSDKITWGGDAWTSEESCGARLAIDDVLHLVLSEKIDSGYLSTFGAEEIVDNILHNNAKSLYSNLLL